MDLKNTELYAGFNGVKVHPNAFVDPSAELHDGVIISQGAVIGPDVTIGERIGNRTECNYFWKNSNWYKQ